ncbi:phytase [Penicillium cinerascens]|uniref:Phytase A n=1 Tax=Penicillium cinerascens TaxID=70096 RepID=A0A9W9SXV5_9EURO|nr:phytase [Penicillium cinerascens]KAJ5201935.1 phytase [Penicillium cinerascens]
MAGYGRPYGRAPVEEEEEALLGIRSNEEHPSPKSSYKRLWTMLGMVVLMGGIVFAVGHLVFGYGTFRSVSPVEGSHPDRNLRVSSARDVARRPQACNSISSGYQCFSDISHRWGFYSPYFSVEDGMSGDVPKGCEVTFVQVLSRHGARYPTASKSKKYAELVADIQANATDFKGSAAFLKDYKYTLGSNDLTTFGERQMIDSGVKFYERYEALTRNNIPFIRSSGSPRVVESGKKFIQGFQQTKNTDRHADRDQNSPKINVIISESKGSNNSLNHNTCATFESSSIGDDVVNNYAARIAPPIAHRLEANLPGVVLSNDDVTYLMDMCAFDTISATKDGSELSPFCDLFTLREWAHYNYLQSLDKYYGYGAGNPLGPTQGVGFVNELIARMTHTPVHDDTSTNHTLDSSTTTFPLNRTLYADFTHDNGLIPIYFAMGLYNGTAPLPTRHIQSASGADGYSAAWTVPFAARAYVEMMQCAKDPNPEPLVRVLVNDRVVPLHGCEVDNYGRCRRNDFINGLSFAEEGGDWASCYD